MRTITPLLVAMLVFSALVYSSAPTLSAPRFYVSGDELHLLVGRTEIEGEETFFETEDADTILALIDQNPQVRTVVLSG